MQSLCRSDAHPQCDAHRAAIRNRSDPIAVIARLHTKMHTSLVHKMHKMNIKV